MYVGITLHLSKYFIFIAIHANQFVYSDRKIVWSAGLDCIFNLSWYLLGLCATIDFVFLLLIYRECAISSAQWTTVW